MKIVIIDNFDSFTYNLAHCVEQYSDQVIVMRNNEVDWKAIDDCDKIIFSPGPGLPEDVKVMGEILDRYKKIKPILGVCLGMQYIGIYFGGEIYNIDKIIHGIPKPTFVTDEQECLFQNISTTFQSGRYHSWALKREKLPSCLKITATDNDNLIMAIRHQELNICGVQFHPESIITEQGSKMLENWIAS
ncbi:aminodeoxychorismate/anthranilate synthase component II [Ancylomarina salipaludis]|uniref:Aminodeoxychorismate/anthranilate synthase component II n=1 Tax=Ancylomarina salipaludis TaxID=2501299 RepID=A0A4Q1JJQ1_9BACT|nr:aminodeoxychorismate/anthranilate synthase component II [Ancylomarina salipaludis]RXQ91570.1 aminodeoxychorismate/anthranilate synthase component II [Ancylomarina salipaludis]